MKVVKWLVGVLIIFILSFGFIEYYSFLFSRTVMGVVIDVQKIEMEGAILSRTTRTEGGDIPFMHSFAIAIKESSGEIVTSSSEDRQWAVVKAGHCVEAKYFPYPPWNLSKSGTYYGARLLKLSECAKN
jgi:hypothetical protein